MKNILSVLLLLCAVTVRSQERYIGLTRDSITKFHAKNFETAAGNDTAMVVKLRRDGTTWRYFKFDKAGICEVAGWEVQFYNEFTDLEKKLKSKKYKSTGEVEYNFIVQKVKGAVYTNGKETYVLMYSALNPNMSASTRAVVNYKGK